MNIQHGGSTELKSKSEVKLAEMNDAIYANVRKRPASSVGNYVPMKDEYESKQRLSMVVSSTVPLAMRSMIRLLAFLP